MADCVHAIESAFVRHAQGETVPPGVLGVHVEGGGFHVKAAGLRASTGGVFAAKVNANFPRNPETRGLPTIQGVLALFDVTDGRLLALMDSIEITSLRTAAATAVAARHLAPHTARVTICGCGEQSRYQLRALAAVRRVARVAAYDIDRARAERFAIDIAHEMGCDTRVIDDIRDVAADTNVWITCTPSDRWFLGREHVRPGAFVAAVGADSPHKQEIEPDLMAANVVIADVLDQCATIGDLHHAIEVGVMRPEDVRAELADVVSRRIAGRREPREIVIFDSTGTALQDVAAASLVYERALESGVGQRISLGATRLSGGYR